MEKGMATHSGTLAWRFLWTEEPGGVESMGSQRVGHNWATNTYIKKWEKSQIDNLILQFKKLERKKKTKRKASRRKKIIKTREELTKIEKP